MKFWGLAGILVEQSSQGNFIPHSHEDILVVAIGQPEDPGHVCVAGTWVGICHFSITVLRHSSSFDLSQEVITQLRQQITEQVTEDVTDKAY